MIWLLRHSHPPSPVSKLSLFVSFRVCCQSSFISDRREGGVERVSSQIIRPKESLVLYKSFNSLWRTPLLFIHFMRHLLIPIIVLQYTVQYTQFLPYPTQRDQFNKHLSIPTNSTNIKCLVVSRDGILGHQFNKRLVSFAPCYS